jgi:hypothetical protein
MMKNENIYRAEHRSVKGENVTEEWFQIIGSLAG